jgi:uncharacterized protein YgiM (DUF1202 family)
MKKTVSNQNKGQFPVFVMLILSVLCLGVLLLAGFPTIASEIRAVTTTPLPPTATESPTPTRTSSPTLTPSYTPSPTAMPTLTPSPTPATIEACVIITNLRVRSGPGTQFQTTAGLNNGECVQLVGKNQAGDWAQYSMGWVSTEFLSFEKDLDFLPVTFQQNTLGTAVGTPSTSP